MPGKDRQRALARAKLERQMAARAASARRRRQWQAGLGAAIAVIVLVAGAALLVTLLPEDEPDQVAATDPASPTCIYNAEAPDSGAQITDVGLPPTEGIAESGTRPMTITTDQGVIEVELDAERATCTTNALSFLAEQKFFDGTPCHRLTTEGLFVLQCGDPSGTGTGSPGFRYASENLPASVIPPYPAGTLAMANSDAPDQGRFDTNGSQFFLVYEDTTLPSAYTIVGTVTTGLDVVQKIAAAGTEDGSADGKPKLATTLTTVTVGPVVEG